jgi:hypothetical protein
VTCEGMAGCKGTQAHFRVLAIHCVKWALIFSVFSVGNRVIAGAIPWKIGVEIQS